MSGAARAQGSSPRLRWLDLAADMIVVALALGPLVSVLSFDREPTKVALAVPATVLLAVLTIYHLRLMRNGVRVLPLAVTLVPLFVASFGLAPFIGSQWYATPAFPLAAVFAALDQRRWWPLSVATIAGEPLLAVLGGAESEAVYGTIQVTLTAAVIYGFSRAVALAHELTRLREELATVAVTSERLRVSRDLHDLLGRSLAAIALKSELALHYQRRGLGDQTRHELEEIVALAHSSGSDLRELVSGYRRMRLEQEIGTSRDLLESNGVATTVDLEGVDDLPLPVDQVLAWTLREAVTNVLRHSDATSCVIEARREPEEVLLRVRNDSGRSPSGVRVFATASSGTGLMGIAERVGTLRGTSHARQHPDGWFELAVRIPVGAVTEAATATEHLHDTSWGMA